MFLYTGTAESLALFAGRRQQEWLGEGDVVIMPATVLQSAEKLLCQGTALQSAEKLMFRVRARL
jgi:hypothetical protein